MMGKKVGLLFAYRNIQTLNTQERERERERETNNEIIVIKEYT